MIISFNFPQLQKARVADIKERLKANGIKYTNKDKKDELLKKLADHQYRSIVGRK